MSPSLIHWYQDVVAPGFGVFLGVVAGTVVTLASQWVISRSTRAQRVRNLKFELRMDVAKLNRWLQEINDYRNAVNGNALAQYFGYFDFSRFIYVTANEMFVSGLLYKYLTEEEIEAMQVITSELSMNGEKFLAQQIQENKTNFVQVTAVGQINFWEQKLTTHRATLQAILQRLG